MKKVFFALICVTSSFLCSMERKTSPRRDLLPTRSRLSSDPSDFLTSRPRVPSNPIERVKDQTKEQARFVRGENAAKLYPDVDIEDKKQR